MTKGKQLISDLLKATALAAVAAFALPDMSWAQTDFGTTAAQLESQELSKMPNLIAAVCYIGGIVLMISGSMKLKAHAENPASEKLSPGLSRLMVGGSIAALPALIGWVNATTQMKGNTLSFNTGLQNPGF